MSEVDMVRASTFLAASFAAGKAAHALRVSPIVGYIAAGALLGPPLAAFAPIPEGFVLAGLLGIQLSVVDAGLAAKLGELRVLATRGLLIAVIGVVFPIAGALAIVCVADVVEGNFETGSSLRRGFACGAAIAPTSLGVSARLLAEQGELETPLGQLVSIAAVFDDVISLVLLAEVVAVANADAQVWTLLRPILFSLLFIAGAVAFSALLPVVIRALTRRIPTPDSLLPQMGLWLIMTAVVGLTYVAHIAQTSFLLAGYLCGVAFADTPEDMAIKPWRTHVFPHIEWLVILFFSSTIGFAIPIRILFSPSSLGIGALLAVAATVGKELCGLGALPSVVDGIAIGVAMLGRGEFGFLIAAQANALGVLDDRLYAATVWGVLVPTLLTPLAFGSVFRWRRKRVGTPSLLSEVREVEVDDIDYCFDASGTSEKPEDKVEACQAMSS